MLSEIAEEDSINALIIQTERDEFKEENSQLILRMKQLQRTVEKLKNENLLLESQLEEEEQGGVGEYESSVIVNDVTSISNGVMDDSVMFISQLAELLQSTSTKISMESIVESLKQKKILLRNIQLKDSSTQSSVTTPVHQNEKLTEIIKRRNEELVELRMKLKEYEDNKGELTSSCSTSFLNGKSRIRVSPSKNAVTRRVLFPLNYNIKVKTPLSFLLRDSGAVVLYGLFMLMTGIVCGLFICVYLYRQGIISHYSSDGVDFHYDDDDGGGREDSLFEFIRNVSF